MMDYLVPVIIAVLGSGGMWAFFQKCMDSKMAKRKEAIDKITEDIQALAESIKTLKEEIDGAKEISLSTSRDRISYLSNKYMEDGFIPKQDIVAYTLMVKTYCKYGNSEVAEKANWCLTNLEVK